MTKFELRLLIREAITEIAYEKMLPEGISPSSIIPIEKFVQSAKMDEADSEFLGAKTSAMSPEEMQAYLDRVKSGAKTNVDRYNLPYVHRGNVEIKNADGRTYDLDKLRASITARPRQILKQNEKMGKSSGEGTVFFDIGLPALKGLAVNEKTGDFVVVDTCPGAGACKVYCYAKKGGYVQWQDASMSQTKLLNFLINDPQGFKSQFESELRTKAGNMIKQGKKVYVRWHDAGDFFSPDYLDLAYSIARDFPEISFYAYTKIASVAKGQKPSNFIINFSMGAKPDQEKQIDFGKDKHSTVIPKPMFDKYILKDDGYKTVRDEKGRIQFKDDAALKSFKKDLAAKYSVPVDSVLTYDEMQETPESDEANKYNVIVRPGDGDVSAARKDVKGTYLLIH